MKFCSKCRTENKDDAVYCNKCGEQFNIIPKQISEYPDHPIYPVIYQNERHPLKIDKKSIISIIFSIIVLILLIVSFFLPWYSLSMNMNGDASYLGKAIHFDGTYNTEYFFTEEKNVNEYEITGTTSDSSIETKKSDYEKGGVKDSMNITLYLTIISIVIAIITILILVAVSLSKITKKFGIIFFSILTIMAFITIIFFTISIPSNLSDDINEGIESGDSPEFLNDFNERFNRQFFGSTSYKIPWSEIPTVPSGVSGNLDLDISWGGGYAWFITVIALIFSICGLVTTIFIKEPLKSINNS